MSGISDLGLSQYPSLKTHTHKQTNKQSMKQTNKQTSKQASRQASNNGTPQNV